MGKFILSLITALTLAHQAQAQNDPNTFPTFQNGKRLDEGCNRSGEPGAYCMGYVIGVVDTFAFVEASSPTKKFCLPKNTSEEQVKDVVVQYLKDHPENRRYAAPSLIYTVLKEKFPCR